MPVGTGTFYFSTAALNDWTSPGNDALWQDALKTLFDPCPTGWRVPKSGERANDPWSALKTTTGNWVTEAATTGWRQNAPAVIGGTAWIPAGGYRKWDAGWYFHVQNEGNQWSSHRTPDRYWILRIMPSSLDNGGDCNYIAIGFPVRCIRE